MSTTVDPSVTPEPPPSPAKRRRGHIQLGSPVTVGHHSRSDVVSAAALASPTSSRDPVDRALNLESTVDHDLRGALVDSITPATTDRPMSVTTVHGGPVGSHALVILRGDLDTVMKASSSGPDTRLWLRRQAGVMARRGFRPLAVATTSQEADGTIGRFELLGFVPVRVARAKSREADTVLRDGDWVMIPVWSITLRWLHWLNVVVIAVLCITGIYIADPFVGSPGIGATNIGFLMGWVRLVHLSVAWGWITLGLVRLYLLFFSKDRFVRWPTLWPLKSVEDLRNLGRTLSAYALIRPDRAPTYIAHNPLQQLSYSAVYALATFQVITGLTLYGLYNVHSGFWGMFNWISRWIGIPNVRLLHYAGMWAFFIFIILHVYLVIRADNVERDGGLSAMVGGSVWIRRGSKLVDDPSI